MQPKNNIVIFSGPSGSGKDYIYRLLRQNHPEFVKVSFSRALKSLLEQTYDLGPGELDTKEGKSKLVPNVFNLGKDTTFLDLLIWAYQDSQSTIFSDLWPSIVRHKITQIWERGQIPVITDMRNGHEARAVFTLENKTAWLYNLERKSAKALESDEQQNEIMIYAVTNNLHRMDDQIMIDCYKNDTPKQAAIIVENILYNLKL